MPNSRTRSSRRLPLLCAAVVAAATPLVPTPVDATSPSTTPAPQFEVSAGDGGSFVALTPERIVDTRPGGIPVGAPDGTGAPLQITVTGTAGVPTTNVGAVALNVTVTDGQNPDIGGGYVTVYPCGTRPDASNLNFTTGQTIPNAVIAPVSPTGDICFYVYGTAHLLADISGYFPTGTGGPGGGGGGGTPSGAFSGVAQISAGGVNSHHTCAVTLDGVAYCWGRAEYGKLGTGSSTTDRDAPRRVDATQMGSVRSISAGTDHTCAVSVTGDAWCWGRNDVGQLGSGATSDGESRPVRVVATQMGKVDEIVAGRDRTCAVAVDGRVWCWGIFLDATPTVVDGSQMGPVRTVDTYDDHTCAITTTDEAWCWGRGLDGRLGDGTEDPSETPVRVVATQMGSVSEIAVGLLHSCAIASAGGVWCWGSNEQRELGDGTEQRRLTPRRVAGGNVDAASSLTLTWQSSCAVADGRVWCWGERTTLFSADCADWDPAWVDRFGVDPDICSGGVTDFAQTARMWRPVAWPNGPVGRFSQMSVASNHLCGVDTSGRAFCWGDAIQVDGLATNAPVAVPAPTN